MPFPFKMADSVVVDEGDNCTQRLEEQRIGALLHIGVP